MNKAISKVFMWLFVGLMVTFITGFTFASNMELVYFVYENNIHWLLFIAELVLVGFLSVRINKMSYQTAVLSYLGYALLTGITLSYIFIVYEIVSIIFVIAFSSIVMLIFSLLGFAINIDMSKIRNLLFGGLIALVIANIINMFLFNGLISLFDINFGLLLFMAFIIYDIQKIKQTIDLSENYAIYGALELYLDFINIFIRLLSLFGDRKK